MQSPPPMPEVPRSWSRLKVVLPEFGQASRSCCMSKARNCGGYSHSQTVRSRKFRQIRAGRTKPIWARNMQPCSLNLDTSYQIQPKHYPLWAQGCSRLRLTKGWDLRRPRSDQRQSISAATIGRFAPAPAFAVAQGIHLTPLTSGQTRVELCTFASQKQIGLATGPPRNSSLPAVLGMGHMYSSFATFRILNLLRSCPFLPGMSSVRSKIVVNSILKSVVGANVKTATRTMLSSLTTFRAM